MARSSGPPGSGGPVERYDTDVDFGSAEYGQRWQDLYRELRERCPVAHSPHHGGFWVVSSGAAVAAVAGDDATYSSDHDPEGARGGFRGVGVPFSSGTRSIPQEVDPPEFHRYRRVLAPRFSRTACEVWRPWLADLATALLDERIGTGRIDFVGDLGFPLPACFVVAWLGLPAQDWRELTHPFHTLVSAAPGSAEHRAAGRLLEDVLALLREVVADRRRAPRGDLISHLTRRGTGLSDDEVVSICQLLFFGGADSTTALLGRSLEWLGRHPDERRRLREEPELTDRATDEFLRYFSPIHFNARTVTRETELGGRRLRAGDRVLISWAAANHDPATVENPERLVVDRAPNRHLAFGVGIHRCLGAHFARLMFETMLSAVLERMPAYEVDLAGATDYPSVGQVNGFAALPATFAPGPRVGTGLEAVLASPPAVPPGPDGTPSRPGPGPAA
ncbi:cytochrome P450 [Streptomyces caatingaensis]|uniref:cytochrome P450 n=1 Tax=Streptomyces caatingaensis TaxID=1678637 RepID=UPI0006727EC2|nr:cytochrome P450 [Streptomyces caatingaensis]